MGNTCSFGHGRKGSDSISEKSDESVRNPPGYTETKSSESVTSPALASETARPPSDVTTRMTTIDELKGGVPKALQDITTSSVCDVSTPSPVVKDFASSEDVGDPCIPVRLQDMSFQQRALLRGRLKAAKYRQRCKKVVLFIISADAKDSQAERKILSENVYPKLRPKFSENGFEVHLVDLYNSQNENASYGRELSELRLWELKKQMESSYVIPILLLNSTFGHQLLPTAIKDADYNLAMSKFEKDHSKEILAKWYKLQEGTESMYRLKPVSSFKEYSSIKGGQLSEWKKEMEELLHDLIEVWPKETASQYCTTPLEEITSNIIPESDLVKSMLWINRSSNTPLHTDPDVQRRLSNLFQELKKQMPEKSILRFPQRPVESGDSEAQQAQLSSQISTALSNIISSIMQEYSQNTLIKPSHGVTSNNFSKLENNYCYGCYREELLNENDTWKNIIDYVKNDSRIPLVICGDSCIGKTSLIAALYEKCIESNLWPEDGCVIVRYGNCLNYSMVDLLGSLADQCNVLLDGEETACTHDIQSYTKILNTSLENTRKPMLFIIDDVSSLKPIDVSWIPQTLPINVKFIITVTHNSEISNKHTDYLADDINEQEKIYEAVKNRLDPKCFMKMSDGNTRSALARILVKLEEEYLQTQKEEDASQTDFITLILNKFDKLLPKIESFFDDFNVANILSVLVASRKGLRESEIIDLLIGCEKLQVSQKSTHESSCFFWSKFCKIMEPFFMYKRDYISLKNGILKAFVINRYKDKVRQAHQILLDYFTGNIKNSKDLYKTDAHNSFYTRKFVESPYHFFHLHNTNDFTKSEYLSSTDWMYKKLCATDCSELLADIELLNSRNLPQHITLLKDFIIQNRMALNYDARQFYSLLNIYFEKKHDFTQTNGIQKSQAVKVSPSLNKIRKFSDNIVQSWYETTKSPPVPSLMILNIDKTADKNEKVEKEKLEFDSLQRLTNGDPYVTSLSTEREEICVWDVLRCRRVRILKGITQPLSLCPVDGSRCIVLCGRELRVFNLDSGAALVKLKGVMNQKMPYYGLHDKEHVVCLSRNRMYVNLMNLESGDCITTFKAGEDRFLNSLLVSGDGRMLVCGDETQKPFPLLVWNLTSRKLLYDLRIPHHDFVTSLAAITFEGNYVCVVCRETTEPSPNFIVVYDLQSGTLFKKWKPSCDTVALEISSADGCVVSGLQDARILVWDLITGNCRHTLVGHTAPVTTLRLDPSGGMLLSADAECRDKSIRLWDLNNGSMLAVFTPSSKITSCEIIQKGKYIALALEGHKDLVALKLCTPGDQKEDDNEKEAEVKYYGLPENDGKVFSFKEAA